MNKNFAFFGKAFCSFALCAMTAMPMAFAQQASAKDSSNPEAQKLFESGTHKNDSKDYQGAVADLNRAISIDPKFGKAYANRASARFNTGDYQGAIQDLDVALKYFPNMPYLLELRGRAVQAGSQPQQQQVVAQQRAYGNALLQQAMLGGDFADPSTMIMMNAQRRGLVRSGPIVNPFANLVPGATMNGNQISNPFAQAQQSDTQSASSKLSAMTQGMSTDDDEPTSQPAPEPQSEPSPAANNMGNAGSAQLSSREYFSRGCDKSKATNYAAAIPEFSKCIELEPGFGDAYANRGLARFHTKDFPGALQDFTEADHLIPNNQELKRYIELSKQAINGATNFR